MRAVLSHHLFHLFVKVVGALLVALSVAMFILGLLTGQSEAYKEMYKFLGSLAEFSAIAGGGVWLVRHGFIQLKKRNVTWQHHVKEWFLFFRRYHTLFGWITLLLVISHGTYFLFSGVDRIGRVYSGIGAFVSLTLVVVFGYVLQRFGKGKNGKSYKKMHQWIALLFGISLVIHLLM
ncbi:hypothetical protein [Anoxybacillus sp. J5B_2022]|uniref:hypothetical protein n=1 Tax=Anoxybacillus sp. J5B_2022 TaxID=3003246 RepID=UPI00228633F9|nr:hypothetical protein [Anoxybacillus sp. J5B_2022]MCZ0754510.1 hypothetical protein [Anoxybacillus sp. J5B_2022]